jgi:hypothetical protein
LTVAGFSTRVLVKPVIAAAIFKIEAPPNVNVAREELL